MTSSNLPADPAVTLVAKLKRRLSRALWFALALIFLLESWLWDNVKDWLRALERRLGLDRLEVWLAEFVSRLSPPMTLALFAVPAVAVFPFKIVALWLFAGGHFFSGLAAIFLVKTLTLGVEAFLFDICRDKLLEMAWFGRFYSMVLDVRAWATILVRPYKEKLVQLAARFKRRALALLGDGGGDFSRRIARLRERAKSKFSA